MPEFLNAIFDGAIIGIICSVAGWVIKKVHDQNEEIEEMFSRLEDCEEKLSQLKKIIFLIYPSCLTTSL